MPRYATVYLDDSRDARLTQAAERIESETHSRPTYGKMLQLALDLWLSQPTTNVRMTPESIELLNDPDRK